MTFSSKGYPQTAVTPEAIVAVYRDGTFRNLSGTSVLDPGFRIVLGIYQYHESMVDYLGGGSPSFRRFSVRLDAPSVPIPLVQDDCKNCGNDGDPVSTYTGDLFNSFPPDLYPGGPMPLYFSRYYASGLKQSGVASRLGDSWRHNFEWYMSVNGMDQTVTNHKGKTITFAHDGVSWNLVGDLTVPYQLIESGGDYIFYDPEVELLYTFDSAGNLVAIGDGKGNTHTLAYTGSDLSTVTDGLGRTLTLAMGRRHTN